MSLDPCWSFPGSSAVRWDHLVGTGGLGHVGRILLCNPGLFGAVDCALGRNVLFWEKQVGSAPARQQGQRWGKQKHLQGPAALGSAAWGTIPAEEITAVPGDWPIHILGKSGIPGWFGAVKPLSFQPLHIPGGSSPSQTIP